MDAAKAAAAFGRPRSVKDITDAAKAFTFNPNVPFKFWIRSANMLYQEAILALGDNDFPQAYLMLYRHSILVVEHLRNHPDFKDPENKKLYRPLFQHISTILQELERLKPIIESQYEEWKRMAPPDKGRGRNDRAGPPSNQRKILDAGENQDLAVDLAQRELRKRDAVRRASRQTGLTREEEMERRKAGSWDYQWATASPRDRDPTYTSTTEMDLQQQMEATRRNLDAVGRPGQDHATGSSWSRGGPTRPRSPTSYSSASPPKPATNAFHYPSTSRSRPINYEPNDWTSSDTPSVPRPPRPPKEPSRPPREEAPGYTPAFHQSDQRPVIHRHHYARPPPEQRGSSEPPYYLPPLPSKEPFNLHFEPAHSTPDPSLAPLEPASSPYSATRPSRPPKEPVATSPQDDGEIKVRKERLTFRPAAYLENGEPIRPVFLPSTLRDSFLEIAEPNTAVGLEMCGILCGTSVNNALFITCLLIPEQKCTADTCETINESATLNFCLTEDLLVIGWIHTHPTQTCFMSSRDLHTQSGYQAMMPESIAIVCAPRSKPSHGIFRLTCPPGLPHILQCTKSDTFHPHSIDNIYTKAEHPPGHVYESSKLEYSIHDLRP